MISKVATHILIVHDNAMFKKKLHSILSSLNDWDNQLNLKIVEMDTKAFSLHQNDFDLIMLDVKALPGLEPLRLNNKDEEQNIVLLFEEENSKSKKSPTDFLKQDMRYQIIGYLIIDNCPDHLLKNFLMDFIAKIKKD